MYLYRIYSNSCFSDITIANERLSISLYVHDIRKSTSYTSINIKFYNKSYLNTLLSSPGHRDFRFGGLQV